jgi:drug/metabolite transporter (DMT)-like permease
MKVLPYLLLIIATMFWSGNFIVSQLFVNELPPFTLSFVRWLIALIAIVPFCWKGIMENRMLWVKEWKIHLIIAITGIISFNTLTNFAVYYTSPVNSALIEASAPVIIPFIARLFVKERLSAVYYVGMILSLLGVLWIVGKGSLLLNFMPNLGDLLMLLGVILWCFYSAIMKKFEGRFPETASFAICIFIGVLLLLPFAATEWKEKIQFLWTPGSILCLLFVGCCSSVLAYLFWNRGVTAIGPSKAALFLTLIPVFTAAFSAVFLGEQLNVNQIFGGITILLGVFISIFLANSKRFFRKTAIHNPDHFQRKVKHYDSKPL